MSERFDPYLEWLQIPASHRPVNHYQLLGLPEFESDGSRIQEAAVSRIAIVRRYQLGAHADDALRLVRELSVAFDCLSTPERKQQYDAALREQQAPSLVIVPPDLVEIRPVEASVQKRPGRSSSRGLFALLAAAGCILVAILGYQLSRPVTVAKAREQPPPQQQKQKQKQGPAVSAKKSQPAAAPSQPSASKPSPPSMPNPQAPTPQPAPPQTAPTAGVWNVAHARYGAQQRWADTTTTVQRLIRNDRIDFQVHNGSMRVDPAFGQIKWLEIELSRGSERKTVRFREGQRVVRFHRLPWRPSSLNCNHEWHACESLAIQDHVDPEQPAMLNQDGLIHAQNETSVGFFGKNNGLVMDRFLFSRRGFRHKSQSVRSRCSPGLYGEERTECYGDPVFFRRHLFRSRCVKLHCNVINNTVNRHGAILLILDRPLTKESRS